MSDAWPPALKDWVAKCLGRTTPANKDAVQAELRNVIQEAFASKTLWTVDWAGIELPSLTPKSTATPAQTLLKRKAETPNIHAANNNKKSKKASPAKYTPFAASEDQLSKEKRARRFEREHEIERRRHLGLATTSHSPFTTGTATPPTFGGDYDGDELAPDPNVIDWDQHTIVGRSQQLFKEYLRLTEHPNPDNIRPLSVLERTLQELKIKWKTDNNYNWICSQFKSLRQDLTVQRIKTSFTVLVYEIHARMALEAVDMVEFNQCLQTLKLLYEMGLPGRKDEFTAYRILYMLHAKQRSDLNKLIGELTPEQKAHKDIRHALDVGTALSTSNYHRLFQLFAVAPNMGGYIMDFFVARERVRALMVMCKAYLAIPLSFAAAELAFEEVTELHDFLLSHKAAFYNETTTSQISDKNLNCKLASPVLSAAFEEKYKRVTLLKSI
ncbi:hypothetical protein SISNIDRAFT_473882 [Sistotremastrum niveocremeum HHB9708]|uniref:PCI domain-containing protein n=1 Tax=Sistotremastrum niveocremeum HHB9708 TaxID=1314777 RepID=A0A164VQ45_9AGAM|nr:hypothetical protein SISNIDRAFT_473882 [Sistotremastrum niveocremeum HHB9708]